jgi:hypothetical protein
VSGLCTVALAPTESPFENALPLIFCDLSADVPGPEWLSYLHKRMRRASRKQDVERDVLGDRGGARVHCGIARAAQA